MRYRNIIIIFSVVFIIILLRHFGATGWADRKIIFLINLGSSAVYNISVSYNGGASRFNSVDDLKKGYVELLDKYNKNVVDQTELALLKEENAGLRELMGFLERNDLSFLGAEVISKSSDALRNTIVINRGSKDGVAMNMPVITGGGFYIGKIRKVELNSSVVQLINDQYSKIAATVLNNNKSIGVVEGGFGLSLQMNFIPQNEDILVGNDVITSGLEAEIPYGLILGRVDIVEKEPYQPFQKAILSPYIDLNKIRTVSVLLSS